MTSIYNRKNQKEKRRQLRKDMTPAEVLLWSRLQRRQVLGYKFHRQYGLGPYIADFYCAPLKLVIELDGDSHFQEGAPEYDSKREGYMNSLGIHTVRILNSEIHDNLDNTIEYLGHLMETREELFPAKKRQRCRLPK